MNSILVVKLADFGDALLTTPAVRAIRGAYPCARIDALTTPASEVVYRRSGLVDDALGSEQSTYARPRSLLPRPLAPAGPGPRLPPDAPPA